MKSEWEVWERAEVKEMHETLKEKKALPEQLGKLGLVYARGLDRMQGKV